MKILTTDWVNRIRKAGMAKEKNTIEREGKV